MNRQPFKRVILMGREGIRGLEETLCALYNYLLQQNIDIGIESNTQTQLCFANVEVVSTLTQYAQYDLLIVIGGDGSLLHAAQLAVEYGLPVLGIHRGRLGFLTDIPPNQLDKIGAVLKGEYQQEQRFLLNAKILEEKQLLSENIALNDVLLLPGNLAHMIMFQIYVNGEFVCEQRADGLIIATPTGSTAYALSGGGPILHPELDAIVLVPMFPHTLSSRPIVLESSSQIEITINKNNRTEAFISCDGRERIAVPPEGRIVVRKHQQTLHLIHPQDYNYFATLREKLHWERNHTATSGV